MFIPDVRFANWRLLLAVIYSLLHHSFALQIQNQAAIPSNPHDPWKPPAFQAASHNDQNSTFCFVVRSYWGHSDDYGGGLRRLIKSLQRQEHQRWEALIIIVDSRPFLDVHSLVRNINDSRVWVFAEWIGPEYRPKEYGEWVRGYHELLYRATDNAVRVCPPQSDWLVVTNGDNEYADGFLSRVIQESQTPDPPPDLVAFDFYSRFQRISLPACERFAARPPPAPLCKSNRRRWCQTDLGASALNLRRFVQEDRRFGDMRNEERALDAQHADGLMMEQLAAAGWIAANVTDACLFVHAPSIQSCAWAGGAWDDRDMIANPGGSCISQAEADAIVAEHADVEELRIDVSNDGNVEAFQDSKQSSMSRVRCLRKQGAARSAVLGLTMVWYSEGCVDDEDRGEFEERMAEFFPTDADLDAAMDAADAHAKAIAQQRQAQ